MIRKKWLNGILFAALPLAWSMAYAQPAFPNKSVRLLLPYSSGVGPDIVARLLAERLGTKWGQSVVVDNRPGASGFLAIQALMAAPADGYNLLVADNGHIAVNPHIHKTLPFESARDFSGITTVLKTNFFITTGAGGPIDSVPKLLAMAKAEPGKLSYGSPFVGSPSHLGGALMEQLTGTSMIHVPFKDVGQMFTQLSTGGVSWALTTAASTRPYLESGKVRFLAVAASKRTPGYENIPTVAEAGGPKDYTVDSWVAVIGRKGTPTAVLNKISQDIGEIMQSAEMRKRLADMGFEATSSSPQYVDTLIAQDTIRYGEVVKKAKIEPQ
jgi:tripartite-type tricarboxylate transporter receptor subunit TctC